MKTTIIIAAVAVVIIVLIITSKQGSTAQSQAGLQGSGYTAPNQFLTPGGQGQIGSTDPLIDLINDSSITAEGSCAKRCRNLTGVSAIRGPCLGKKCKAKRTAFQKCKEDCARGANIESIY